MQQRKERVAASIRTELARALREDMQDPRLGFVTITGVNVSPDLRHARVFVSVLESDDARRQQLLDSLRGARGFLRRQLASNLALRRTPELEFRLDLSGEQGDQIDRLLRQDAGRGNDHGPDTE